MPLIKARFRENCLKKIKKLHKHNELYRNSLINKKLYEELNKRKKVQFFFICLLDLKQILEKLLQK